MSRTLYFSKVSFDSQEVYDLVENYDRRYEYTSNILSMLKHGTTFKDEYSYIDENGEVRSGVIVYTLSIRDKDNSSISGYLDRTSDLFVKQCDKNGDLKTHPVDNTERIVFYYDVLHEYIAYDTRQRFGKNMFNDAFGKLMNHCAKKSGLNYSFYLGTYNQGMTVEEIQESIKKDKQIKKLTITYRPANPDEKMIKKAKEASESDKIKETKATERSIIYLAKGNDCIDGGAQIIQDDIRDLVNINRDMQVQEMTQYNYIQIISINEKGDVKTTADEKPFTCRFKEGVDNFVEVAKNGITQILRR